MELEKDKNYEDENIEIEVRGQKEPKKLIKTSKKSAYWLNENNELKYSHFKNICIWNPARPRWIKEKKPKFRKTDIEMEMVFGGHMSNPPYNCKKIDKVFYDKRTSIHWIDLNICTLNCKNSKCKRWNEYRLERKRARIEARRNTD